MKDGKLCKSITEYFIESTNKKVTPATMRMNMAQVQTLLDAGYTEGNIRTCIAYCSVHPPKNGFNSMGWCAYVIDDVLKKEQAKIIKQEQNTMLSGTINANVITHEIVKQTHNERVNSDFDFDLFEDKK